MVNKVESQAGAAALKTYIDSMLEANGLGWEEMFIPDTVYATGATDAIAAADASAPQSSEARQVAAAAALRKAIDSTGYGDKVSDTNIAEAATAILTAVAKVRAQENPPKPAAPAVAPLALDALPASQSGLQQPTPDTASPAPDGETEASSMPHEDDDEGDENDLN